MQFNTEALTRPVTQAERAAIKARARQGYYGPAPSSLGLVVAGVLLALTAIPIAVFLAGSLIVDPGAYRIIGFMGVATVVMAALLIGIFLVAWQGQDRRWITLAAFADANGLQYRRRSQNPYYPGLLFGVARSSAVTEHIYSDAGTFADAGSYTYQVRTGKSSVTYVWHYAAFRLPRPMPHIVLDATANNSALGSNLPVSFRGSQVVKLGDPFDQIYRLYAPDEYELDAFYLFPPDLMEMLVQAPVVMDIEIIDSWMFCYAKQQLDMLHPYTWQILGYIDQTIVGRMNRIDVRYTDSRVASYQAGASAVAPGHSPPPIGPGQAVRRPWIAPRGRRLRPSMTRLWVMLILMMLSMAVPVVASLIATLFAR